MIYDKSNILILDRVCFNPVIPRITGFIFSEYREGGRRQLFFEDYQSARLFARGRQDTISWNENERPEPMAIEDQMLGESSINGMAEAQYSEFVEAYGVTVLDVGMS